MSWTLKLKFCVLRQMKRKTATAVAEEIFTSLKLGTKQGLLQGVYSRNQFEPLPEPLLLVSDVSQEIKIALRSAANKQSKVVAIFFFKCGCMKTCQANNCKCTKNNHE